MIRFSLLTMCLATAACGAETPPVQSTSSSTSLFRGGAGEVRLRCGSETIRAKLRAGRLVAQIDGSESRILVPVNDPRAMSGPAYSDGKLTLYKVPDATGWTFANGDAATAQCSPPQAGH
jgi:hypothetical protein